MKLFHKIISLFSNLTIAVLSRVSSTPDLKRNHVPYVSQFANPAWAEMVLKSNQPLAKDHLWRHSGARTIEEYERWALVICGMACTSMAVAFYKNEQLPTVLLARDAAKSGVYKKDGDGISDMQYVPFVRWIKQFDLRATIYTKLSFRSIRLLLAKNNLVIASVNPNIRGYNTAPALQVGGHLVLVTGYNKKDKTVTFHNPSGFENNQSQINHTMQYKEFEIYFSGRGIAVRNA